MVRRLSVWVIGAMLSLTCVNAYGQDFKGVTLRVGTFGGTWKDAVDKYVGKRLEEKGIKIEYVLGNPADNFAKIIAARGQQPPIDVMEIGPAERVQMLDADVLADIPMARITNLPKVSAKVVEPKLIPHIIIQNGIVYRSDVFEQENMQVPEKYSDLATERLANRVAFPDVTNTQFWTAAAALAYEVGGNESTPETAFAEISKIKPLYFFSAASELAQKFSLGDVVAAPWHVGWALRLARAGMEVGFTNPIVGNQRGAIEYNYLGIIKGTPNTEAAAAFIDAFIETNAQVEFGKAMGAVPTNKEARGAFAEDPLMAKLMLLKDSDLEQAFIVDWSKIDQQAWRSDWARSINK